MKSLLKTSVGIAALLTGAGMAMAQDTGNTGTQQMASDVTCSHIVALDTEELERALYFVAGYTAAQDEMGTSSDTSASASGSTSTTGSGTTASAGSSDSGSSADMDMGTDTTASADDLGSDTGTDTTASTSGTDTSGGATTSMDTDTMASDDAAGTGTDSTITSGTTSSTDTSGSAGSEKFAATGYFPIPVEAVLTACQETPDSRVSDVMEQQGSSAQ